MKKFQNTPAFWRYFRARFKPFTRPLFLGSVGFITLSGIALYEYWLHPDWLENRIEQPLEAVFGSRNNNPIPPVLEDDLAALADVDNIELLLQEMAQNQITNSFNAVPNPKNNSSKDASDTAFSRFKKKQENKLKNASSSNPSYLKTNNNALNDLLKPPSLTIDRSNSSNINNSNLNSNNSNSAIISNPITKPNLSNQNSAFRNTISAPYIPKSPLSKLGDRSGNFNFRQRSFNQTVTGNNSNNLGDFINPNTTSNSSQNINSVNTQTSDKVFQQNNSNIYSAPNSNYNQSVPSKYQLQPRSFGQQNSIKSNQINSGNSKSNSIQNQGQDNSQLRQFNNQPIINVSPSPTLQPAGSLSTSPLQ